MFKKSMMIMVMVAMMVMMMGCGSNIVSAGFCMSEDARPNIVGLEHLDRVNELGDLWDEGEIEIPYRIEMNRAEEIWVVHLVGEDVDGYEAYGFYDHMPTEKDLEILWANRMTEDEMWELVTKDCDQK